MDMGPHCAVCHILGASIRKGVQAKPLFSWPPMAAIFHQSRMYVTSLLLSSRPVLTLPRPGVLALQMHMREKTGRFVEPEELEFGPSRMFDS